MPIYLRPGETSPSQIKLRDPTQADSGATFTVAVSATQAPATASAALLERFVAAAVATQTQATANAALTERFSTSLGAVQSPAIASVALTERFIASLAALQSPATFASALREVFEIATAATQSPATAGAALSEEFLLLVAATQLPATASVQVSTPVDISLAIAAAQSPATLSATLQGPPVEVQGGGYAAYPQPYRWVAVHLHQAPHTARARLSIIPRSVAVVSATQRSATCVADLELDSLNVSEEEAALFTVLMAA